MFQWSLPRNAGIKRRISSCSQSLCLLSPPHSLPVHPVLSALSFLRSYCRPPSSFLCYLVLKDIAVNTVCLQTQEGTLIDLLMDSFSTKNKEILSNTVDLGKIETHRNQTSFQYCFNILMLLSTGDPSSLYSCLSPSELWDRLQYPGYP